MSKKMNFVMFTAGAVIGSVVTWLIAKKKFEEKAQEEIKSVKEAFEKYNTPKEDPDMDASAKPSKEVFKDVVEKIKEEPAKQDPADVNKYNTVTERYKKPSEPYVISPDEFGEYQSYKLENLTYYADRVLANEAGDLVDVNIVGKKSLEQFGEYEDDAVHVRNRKLKTDYEILLDPREYSDVYRGRDTDD